MLIKAPAVVECQHQNPLVPGLVGVSLRVMTVFLIIAGLRDEPHLYPPSVLGTCGCLVVGLHFLESIFAGGQNCTPILVPQS